MVDGAPVLKGFGVVDIAEVRKLTGLEFMQAIIDGKFPAPSISRAMNMRMIDVGEGFAVFSGTPGENYYNPMGTLHGGYLATMLDSALGCCVQTLCPAGTASTSIDLKVNFVRPVTAKTGRLFARADVVHPGRQIATCEGRLTDENGKLYAHGTQACSIFKLPEG